LEFRSTVSQGAERLLNPAQYFEQLEDLESAVFEQSAVSGYLAALTLTASVPTSAGFSNDVISFNAEGGQIQTPSASTSATQADAVGDYSNLNIPSPRIALLPSSSMNARASASRIEAVYSKARKDAKDVVASRLYHLLECRNLAQRVLYNVVRLVESGYISDRISVLVLDSKRANVAKLVPISLEKIRDLITHFSTEANAASNNGDVAYKVLTSACKGFLSSLGLSRKTNVGQSNRQNSGSYEFIWRCAIHTLDLAVVLYAGAHSKSLNERYLDGKVFSFNVPGPFLSDRSDAGLERAGADYASIVFRRPLQCLNGLLDGNMVWVFHPSSAQSLQEELERTPLHLATDAKTLADIWGPMWKVSLTDSPAITASILRYQLGNGSIVPWKAPQNVTLFKDEVYCHWFSDFEKADLKDASVRWLKGIEPLVIGAAPVLQEKPNCLRNDCAWAQESLL
jgi:hypothetical protein